MHFIIHIDEQIKHQINAIFPITAIAKKNEKKCNVVFLILLHLLSNTEREFYNI